MAYLRLVLACLTVSFTNANLRSLAKGNLKPEEANKADANAPLLGPSEDDVIPVIPLCCDFHDYFDTDYNVCLKMEFEPPKLLFQSKDGALVAEKSRYLNTTRLNTCPSYFLPHSEFHLLTTGQLLLKAKNDMGMGTGAGRSIAVESSQFCLLWVAQNDTYDMAALVCFPEQEEDEAYTFRTIAYSYLLPILMTISALFLAATFVVYCLVGELQDFLGKCFMCSVATLFLSKVFGVITKVFTRYMEKTTCIVMGVLMHVGFLHSFFWLNVISLIVFFYIWFQGRVNMCSKRRWFALSCIYAFGMPLVIFGLALIHDLTPHLDDFMVPYPGFGVGNCGFSNRGAQVVYFYAPIAILLGVNLILFLLSACRLFILTKQSSAYAFQFNNYLKLLLLMGIPWIFEVLSFFFDQGDKLTTLSFVWLAFDIFNALQGLIIFIVFACRRAVFARVSETLCGGEYARRKYPDVFLQNANEETHDGSTQDLRLVEPDRKGTTNPSP